MDSKPPSSAGASVETVQRVGTDTTATSPEPEPTWEAISQKPARSVLSSFLLIATCTMAMLINTSNSTSVAISLSTIGRELDISEAQLQWLVSAYALSSGCLLLMFGRLADLYGRKRVFILGSIWLAAFTLGCGFAQSNLTLDILRGLQGVGVAASIPASLGILAHAFPPGRTRSIAFASFAAGAPIGAFMGNALGAVLTQLSEPSWRSTFFLSTGLTVLYILTGVVTIDPDEPSLEADRRVDWLGAFLVTAGLVLIVFVLSDGEIAPQGWRTPYIIACLIIGVLLVLLFLAWQWYLERLHNTLGGSQSVFTPPPLMKLSLWTRGHGKFSVIMVIALFNWCAFMGWMFWIQLYYQQYEHRSPVLTMVRLIPMFVFGLLCNLIIVLIVARISITWILCGYIVVPISALLRAYSERNHTHGLRCLVIRIDPPPIDLLGFRLSKYKSCGIWC
ncbi:hypothetical protein AX16_001964 [Volvariella volvacea WC 439]|nr:hypothetical protein AX16_001964 [Volvariella volvacea WC 439]